MKDYIFEYIDDAFDKTHELWICSAKNGDEAMEKFRKKYPRNRIVKIVSE